MRMSGTSLEPSAADASTDSTPLTEPLTTSGENDHRIIESTLTHPPIGAFVFDKTVKKQMGLLVSVNSH